MTAAAADTTAELVGPRELAYAKNVAKKLARKFPHLADELESAACFGLAEAAHRFDRPSNDGFEAYAFARIRGACLDAVRSSGLRGYGRRANRPTVSSLSLRYHDDGAEWADLIPAPVDTRTEHAESAEAVRALLRPYGADGVALARYYAEDGHTLYQVADDLGVSSSQASIINSRILADLRERLAVNGKIDPERVKGRIAAIAEERRRLGRPPTTEEVQAVLDRYDEALRLAGARPAAPAPAPPPKENTPVPATTPSKNGAACKKCGGEKSWRRGQGYACLVCDDLPPPPARPEPAPAATPSEVSAALDRMVGAFPDLPAPEQAEAADLAGVLAELDAQRAAVAALAPLAPEARRRVAAWLAAAMGGAA